MLRLRKDIEVYLSFLFILVAKMFPPTKRGESCACGLVVGNDVKTVILERLKATTGLGLRGVQVIRLSRWSSHAGNLTCSLLRPCRCKVGARNALV